MVGSTAGRFFPQPASNEYAYHPEPIHILMKVETHNHPTAISPYAGAATGSGGEIRDEGATGQGSKPKAGMTGFTVSNLKIPQFIQPWEVDYGKPERIVSALDIMLEGPIGGASFNNEFGRPAICGYFRTYEQAITFGDEVEIRGYHKPIMIAGGLGNIREQHVEKGQIQAGDHIIVLGGPAMLIGLGGGAASSMDSGASSADLDFASVQRDNPEMERRCQEVIDRCWALGDKNPIVSIHDVGAGGLSNALPELVHDAERGGRFELRRVPNDEPGMAPVGIWCNEAQERYVLAVRPDDLDGFEAIAKRERCPFAVLGEATHEEHLALSDAHFDNSPIDLPMSVLFGKPPKMHRDVTSVARPNQPLSVSIALGEAIERVLSLPTVADKSFLITIGDRSVTGMVTRDQMVGPWQVPVADCAVTTSALDTYSGEAMSMGERTPLASLDFAAAAKMAVGEAITNIAAAPIKQLDQIKLSANWMAAAGHPGEDAGLYEAVEAVGMDLCPKLGLTIPVGKDSMSMRTKWREQETDKVVVAPVSLVISAFAAVTDVRRTLTPQLKKEPGELWLIDLGFARNRMGGSALAQVCNQLGNEAPTVDDADSLKAFFEAIQRLNSEGCIRAYHDRSDGGLITTLVEMAFAGGCGIDIDLSGLDGESDAILFNEELGAVIQVPAAKAAAAQQIIDEASLAPCTYKVGHINSHSTISIVREGETLYSNTCQKLRELWSATSYHMQSLRDNPECARQEFNAKLDSQDPGMTPRVDFNMNEDVAAPYIATGVRPQMAVLREQGVNGQIEMAAAFDRAGFSAIDVHMSDILAGKVSLDDFKGLVACGGFSYGDVLGAGEGWAKSILFNSQAREGFSRFFERQDTFALGVCNGCQMLSNLNALIPGADHWPRFVRNVSEQFEARFSLVAIEESPSIMLQGMAGSHLPIAVAHGEGRAEFKSDAHIAAVVERSAVALRYVNNSGVVTEQYPANPNGSPEGITGLCNDDGRVTIMMPHPERVYRTVQHSWHPEGWGEDAPWMRMFRNARKWVG
jgi:phosphoribosylformylglycinamidine synthase